MADSTISLRAYIQKLDDLLNNDATDEVIFHAEHILRHFPRNVTVYRQLGRAYLLKSKWDEARAVLRRVLSVLPDDFIAHVGLSEVYSQRSQANNAIWHLERAYEQRPNDTEIIAQLRELYRRYHNTDQTRLQLTTAAVARQYARSGMYDQALNTLRNALERLPDRVDLRLLLAEILWTTGQTIPAGEAALDVLEELPDCLTANRIMTELWLNEGRPSDAQRYVGRIEAIDPYLALQLAGMDVNEDAFTLPEKDYEAERLRDVSGAEPDWLGDIDASAAAFTALFTSDPPPDTAQPEQPSASWPQFEQELSGADDDIFTGLDDNAWLDQLEGDAPTNTDAEFDALFDNLDDDHGDDDAILRELEQALENEQDLPESSRNADMAAAIDSAVPPASTHDADTRHRGDDLPDWLTDTPTERTTEVDASAEAALWQQAWDANSGAETSEDDQADDSTGPGWLDAYDIELDESQERSALLPFGEDESTIIESSAASPTDWMADYGIEMDETDSADNPVGAPADDDHVDDWLRAQGIDLDETASEPVAPPDDEPDSPDWMAASAAHEEPPAEPPGSGDLFGWLQDDSTQQDAAVDLPPPDDQPLTDTEMLANERLRALQADEDAANEFTFPDEAPGTPLADKDEIMPDKDDQQFPDWLNSSSDDDDAANDDMPDWLREMRPAAADEPDDQPAEAQAADDGFEWLDANASAEPTPSDDMPDWLRGMQPADDSTDDSSSTSIDFGDHGDGGFEWMSAGDDDSADEPAAAADPGTQQFGWDTDDETAASFEQQGAPADSGFEWLDDNTSSDTPDWLSQMQGERETPAETPQYNWEDEETDFSEAPSAATGMTDMLRNIGQSADDQPSAADSGADPDEDDAPDWLSALSQTDASQQPAAPGSEASTFDFGAPTGDRDDSAAPGFNFDAMAGDDTPDWLSDLSAQADDEPLPDDQPATTGMTDWLTDLSQSGGSDTGDTFDFEQAAASTEGDEPATWYGEASEEDEIFAAAADESATKGMTDWLSSLSQPSQDDEPERATFDFDRATADENAFERATQDTGATTDDETPDWLAELSHREPDSLSDSDPDDLTVDEFPTQETTPEWLTELAAEPERQPNPADLDFGAEDDQAFTWASGDSEADAGLDWQSELAASTATDEPGAETGLDHDAAEADKPQPTPVESGDTPPDWLAELGEDYTRPEELTAFTASADYPEPEDVNPDWEPDEAPPAPVSGVLDPTVDDQPMLPPSDAADPDLLTETTSWPEDEFDAALETGEADDIDDEGTDHTPAENAPDWLNAMVPGLDVDYAAEEDAPLEQDIASDQEAATREYGWLVDIVTEETAAQPEPAGGEARREPRFQFSRRPAWLRALIGDRPAQSNQTDNWLQNDRPASDNDLDLPDWLK